MNGVRSFVQMDSKRCEASQGWCGIPCGREPRGRGWWKRTRCVWYRGIQEMRGRDSQRRCGGLSSGRRCYSVGIRTNVVFQYFPVRWDIPRYFAFSHPCPEFCSSSNARFDRLTPRVVVPLASVEVEVHLRDAILPQDLTQCQRKHRVVLSCSPNISVLFF